VIRCDKFIESQQLCTTDTESFDFIGIFAPRERSTGPCIGEMYLGISTQNWRAGEGRIEKWVHRSINIVFHLLSVADAERFEESMDSTEDEKSSGAHDLEETRRRALAAASTAESPGEHGVRNLYKRSRAVRDYVFLRANGVCESCKKSASFNRPDGSPYLEPHHTTRF
jgi:5-methylcytosine-specific restriction protein A